MDENQIQIESQIFSITNINVAASEEDFLITITTGNQARRYQISPKHAKRVSMLLSQWVSQYESQFGELETSLPVAGADAAQGVPIGFQIDQDVD